MPEKPAANGALEIINVSKESRLSGKIFLVTWPSFAFGLMVGFAWNCWFHH